ncbi:PAS domain-containing protein [Caballeronia sp. LZ019]|uniref:PAS domain-containing protein n=1 Tax=Caballeronia sp. LZ019 TaxID=3038555 RepID=UPI00285C9A95|nr:PAS domain-containing protein [Caballeronia sp. LZ019]MDR5808851.1 PAS domain-containing protein [Caballeronia sp. LZ019]
MSGTEDKTPDVEGGGQSVGIPAAGELDNHSFTPTGASDRQHWQAGYVSNPGLDDRSGVFFAAVEMTRMPMVVTDPRLPDNPIVFVNGAFLDLTQCTEDEVIGRNCRILQGKDTDPETVDEIREGLREQRAVAVEILNYKADGTPFWNALFLGPIFDKDNNLVHFFASQMDITRRRVSEQAFRQAQKMESIGQLTAGLAHDFNNLLQVVTGNLELAKRRIEGHGDALLETLIDNAKGAAERGGRLTQQLLTFARKQQLAPKSVNLNTLVLEFSDMLASTLGRHIDLRLDLKPGLPVTMLDPEHLEMALLNILINARDAMPHGGKATVATSIMSLGTGSAERHLPAGRYVILCVHDEGTGMDAETLRRAAEPFFTTKGPGTGLGLAMVHGFMQQSNGRLEIESTVGKGSIVKMIFPLAAD